MDDAKTTTARSGPWILTSSGRKVYLCDPRPEDIDLSDIAHALAHINRWTGHTVRPYSVAQHAALVAEVVERLAPDQALAALHHDDAEAYMGDINRPVKSCLGAAIANMERDLMAAIMAALDVRQPTADGWHVIAAADDRVLAAERVELLPPVDAADWTHLGLPASVAIVPMRAQEAERLFLEMHWRLKGAYQVAP